MEILRFPNSQAYLFNSKVSSNKLIIVLEGSGWSSVLGVKQKNIWPEVRYGAQFIQELNNDYTFLIPEKLKRQPGMVYFEDIEDRANYTAENLLACYSESINSYLNDNNFSSVILIAGSEGAILLPLLYEKIDKKDDITMMVSLQFGGFSMYEAYKILSESLIAPQDYKNMYKHIVEVYEFMEDYKTKNDEINITPEEDFYGFNYRWFDSFLGIRPFDYYKNITIPMLFVHGEADYNIPVKSTIYIQENLPDKPFDYKYFEWDHQPRNYSEMIRFRKEVAEWIIMKTP
ncbi:MAG: prolyl oligopeptidase family serine peptidase [Treponema sp.]|nr:prolyl oligopeptidase family serine peptidase [Treponema sp.]